jgi:hypothetical protein
MPQDIILDDIMTHDIKYNHILIGEVKEEATVQIPWKRISLWPFLKKCPANLWKWTIAHIISKFQSDLIKQGNISIRYI